MILGHLTLAMLIALVGLLGGALGCGGSAATPVTAPADPQGSGAGSAAAEGGSDDAGTPGPPGAPLDDAECTQLADHLVDVSVAGRRPAPAAGAGAGAGAEEYTAEDAESAKRELRQSLRPACAQLSRRDFHCAMAARTAAELGACQK